MAVRAAMVLLSFRNARRRRFGAGKASWVTPSFRAKAERKLGLGAVAARWDCKIIRPRAARLERCGRYPIDLAVSTIFLCLLVSYR